jgi:hypothetical protein
MTLSEILGWISRNGWAAFFIGCFLSGLAVTLANFFIHVVRSITGNFPPPRPVSCDHLSQCYCCRNGSCNENCRCHDIMTDDDDGGEEGEDEDV